MRRMTLPFTLFVLLAIFSSRPEADQSFDCRKAVTAVERMICADPALSTLDEQMARVFTEARSQGRVTAADQAAWLKTVRNRCADAACLKAAYTQRIAVSVDGLAGEWSRLGDTQYERSVLVIDKVTTARFHFVVNATSGGHAGDIDGVAVRTAADALFKEEDCQVRFTRNRDRLVLTETSSACGGAYVAFGGEYARGAKARWLTLTDLGILAPNVTEKAFQAVVGKDYELFGSSFQLRSDEKDLDGLGAKVVSGAVAGLFTLMEAIVMSRPDGRIFAAVIDGDVVKYFSNDPVFKTKLPATIEEWRANFTDKKVIFPKIR